MTDADLARMRNTGPATSKALLATYCRLGAREIAAQRERIKELEARIKGFLEAEADSAGGAPDKSEARHKAFIALRCSVDWPTKASCDAARAALTPKEDKE